MQKHLDILAFAPHPDDAELGCGGTLIRSAGQGLKTAIADLSRGECSSRGSVAERERSTEIAGQLMDLAHRFSLDLPDTRIGTDPGHREPLIRLLRETRPRVVLAPFPGDRHPDHAAAGRLVQDACYMAGLAKIGKESAHRPERLYYYTAHYLKTRFDPSFVIDISDVWDRKLEVVSTYGKQFRSEGGGFPTVLSRPEFTRFIQTRDAWYGAMIGAAFGEAFFTPGPVPLGKIPGLDQPPPSSGKLPPFSMY